MNNDDGSFAKLFGSGRNQILVIRQTHDTTCRPEIRVFFQPPNLGVCSAAIGFDDTDKGWDQRNKVFSEVDEDFAWKVADQILNELDSQ